ncbi:MAG: cell wall hydrolase, partial [Chloroflexota bacterium]|nr:cell wall hydrolase [Chloroflexota bacterium]
IPLTYKYTNGTFNHPVQPLGNHPTTPNTYYIGMAFEWLTMIPSSDHIPDYQYDGGMQFNFRGISAQSNGGSFRHRRGVIQWIESGQSPKHCGITYAAHWMPNYTANAAQICTYYLPGSTASIGGGATLVNGTSRGSFAPSSMSMSNWGVNMRGTARVRYIYWRQEAATPVPTVPPTATPVSTLTPTAIPQVYHIPCTISSNNGYVRVRNFPASDFETMTNSDGQIVMELYQGTTVNVYEFRMARDGVQWARISPYEAYMNNTFVGDTLWVRTAEPGPGGAPLLQAGPANCGGSAPTPYLNMSATPRPPVPASFAPVPAGCGSGNICVHQTWNPTNAQDQVNIVAFVLACEAGNSQAQEDRDDALAVAYVIRNRMRSLTYYGTADQVVRQSGQFDCWNVGAPSGSGITNTAPGYGIDPTIYNYAVALLNGNLSTQYSGVFNGAVRDLGLYFFGIYVPQGANYASNPAAVMAVATQSCNSPRLSTIYIGIAPYRNVQGGDNANTYFYDNHGC